MGKRKRETWAKWRRLVSEQGGSGESVAAFCRERGLCASQFFTWKKRLGQAQTGFVAVEVVEGPRRLAIEVRLNGGRSLMVEPGFDAEHLRAVLAVVETRA